MAEVTRDYLDKAIEALELRIMNQTRESQEKVLAPVIGRVQGLEEKAKGLASSEELGKLQQNLGTKASAEDLGNLTGQLADKISKQELPAEVQRCLGDRNNPACKVVLEAFAQQQQEQQAAADEGHGHLPHADWPEVAECPTCEPRLRDHLAHDPALRPTQKGSLEAMDPEQRRQMLEELGFVPKPEEKPAQPAQPDQQRAGLFARR